MAIGIQSGGRVSFAGLGLGFQAQEHGTTTEEQPFLEKVRTLPELDFTGDRVNYANPSLVSPLGVPTVGGVIAAWAPPVLLAGGGLFLASKGYKKTATALVVLGALSAVFGAATVTQAFATNRPTFAGV